MGTFNVGIDWKYDDDEQTEYTVTQYYDNLKQEMLEYQYLKHGKLSEIFAKAARLQQTEVAKSTFCVKGNVIGDSLNWDQLICIILYTDHTDLSTYFTKSFRKSSELESLSDVKKRNEKYYHWSKILKDTVRCWGKCSARDWGNGRLQGPFYCGLNMILSMPQFCMYLYSPTSTSAQLEVALRFAGEYGIILEMDLSGKKSSLLRAMDVSWISRYKEEDERYVSILPLLKASVLPLIHSLFFGCRHGMLDMVTHDCPINISSIREIETATNYSMIIEAITIFDNVISGNLDSYSKPSGKALKKAMPILQYLISSRGQIQYQNPHKLPLFIYRSFKAFLMDKKTIKINMLYLDEHIVDLEFLKLIFGGKGLQRYRLENDKKNYTIPDDYTNIFRLNLFQRIESITIVSVQTGNLYWSFSLLNFLTLLQNSSIEEIKMTTQLSTNKSSWISDSWTRNDSYLIQEYQRAGYHIEYQLDDGGSSASYHDDPEDEDSDEEILTYFAHYIYIRKMKR